MYKSIIYIKNGLHIDPLLGLNVVQYTKPLTNFKNAQGSPKNGLRRSANAILRRYCRLKTDVKIIIYSRDIAGSFCYSLAKSNVFAPLTLLRNVQRKTLLPRATGCTPFLTLTVQKIHCFFGPQSGLEKIGASNAPKKLLHAIFACPSFAKKIISASLKLSAKNGIRPSHELACDLSANCADKKRESV